MHVKTSFKRILVIKLRHLGDVLLSGPVFSNLREVYPDAKIDAYIWKEARPMLEGHPAVDGFLLHDRGWKKLSFFRRIIKEFGLLREIRKGKYDLVINLTEGDRGVIAAYLSGAKVRVGVKPKKKFQTKLLTHVVKPCPNPRHTVEKDLDALRVLKIFPKQRDLVFAVPEGSKNRALELVAEEQFILVHAVSRWRFKCPPAHVMAQVLNQLDLPVVLTGAHSEREFVESIASLTKQEVINVAGMTSLKEMGALMVRAKGVITVDSVCLHMASALQVPLVAIFGPSSEKNWGPWRHPLARVVAKDLPCRPCRLDGCGGSKMSDCLWTLSPEDIVRAYYEVTSATADISASSLLSLNSFEMNFTE